MYIHKGLVNFLPRITKADDTLRIYLTWAFSGSPALRLSSRHHLFLIRLLRRPHPVSPHKLAARDSSLADDPSSCGCIGRRKSHCLLDSRSVKYTSSSVYYAAYLVIITIRNELHLVLQWSERPIWFYVT